MYIRGKALVLLCLVSLAVISLAGCGGPVLIERDAEAVALSDSAWRLQWKDFDRQEETRTVVGRQVTVRAGSHLALWARDFQSAIVTASTPELLVFGHDANPVAGFTDQELVQFAIGTALTRAGGATGLTLPQDPVLHLEQAVVIDAPYGQLTGSQFRVAAQEIAVTLAILRTRSGSDHIIVMGLMPHPLQQTDWDTFTSAVQSSRHPVADLGEPEPLALPSQITVAPAPVPAAKPDSGWLGVRVADVPPEAARQMGVQSVAGALVVEVLPNSPARQAGLRTYDLVLAVDGEPVATAAELVARIRSHAPQVELVLRIWSQNSTKDVRVRLAALPRGQADRGL